MVCKTLQPVVVYHYESSPRQHAEMKFLEDLKSKKAFNGNTQFDLYINYTPCHWEDGCCKALTEVAQANYKIQIYAVGVYEKEKDDDKKFSFNNWERNIKALKAAGVKLKALCEKEREALLHYLVPADHEDAFKKAFKNYTAAMNEAFDIYMR